MKYRKMAALALCMCLMLTTACSAGEAPQTAGGEGTGSEAAGAETTDGAPSETAGKDAADAPEEESAPEMRTEAVEALPRPMLLGAGALTETSEVEASVPDYTIRQDLSNVINADSAYYLTEGLEKTLAGNGFAVVDNGGSEFFETYEFNRYANIPSFVTVDSMMHTYHLYFSYLMKQTELNHLSERLEALSRRMLDHSAAQYDALTGSEWEEAAARNVAFFAVGASLLEVKPEVPAYVKKTVQEELALIDAGEGIADSPLTGAMEDYSQYKPRGYYDTDARLKRYFRAMMWYGRRNFAQSDESLNRSALLMTLAMEDEALSDWETIYAVTSFFAGASDDAGYYEYRPMIDAAYGEDADAAALIGDTDGWKRFQELSAQLSPPAINSVPMPDDNGETDKREENTGYRFMGQRFSVDAAIFQELIYSEVGENAAGERRMLPDGLDVPAALGSDTALELLKESGATEYKDYGAHMEALRTALADAPETLWTASLYAGWLDTLRPLLAEKGDGYPFFMRNEEWRKKNLESFLGSWTELKHDTVLYSKQVIAEMGGGDEEEDMRGYVEPESEVYAHLAALTEKTAKGLDAYGVLPENAETDMERLSVLAKRLQTISEKELRDELLTDDEYELILDYGGELEHFWKEALKEDAGREYFMGAEFPAALVTDVATDPNGSVLQVATGNPADLYVIVPVDGTLRITRGSVFSYYQFERPISDRLTDMEWRVELGIEPDERGEYRWPVEVQGVDWARSYRAE